MCNDVCCRSEDTGRKITFSTFWKWEFPKVIWKWEIARHPVLAYLT